jgi:hypothetical protein
MTTFNFPTTGIDVFTPEPLLNDVHVVSANHIIDLRLSIQGIESALIGITPFPYSNTNIIEDGYNIKLALETFDAHIYALETQLGFYFDAYSFDGYASRIDTIESTMLAHRVESYQTDSDGYSVHGVSGYVVGTENFQTLNNKKVDSGPSQVGPKFVARSNLSDAGNRQIEVYSSLGQLTAWIDEAGDAYFAGDLVVEGGRVIKGVDVIQNSLFVDGYNILGDNPSTDYTTISGALNVYGTIVPPTLSVTTLGDITAPGSNMDFGDGTGTLNADFALVDITGDAYVRGTLTASGPVNLGDGVGSDPVTIKGSIIHTNGVLHSTGEFRALGTKFRVEGTTTTVDTTQLVINSNTTVMPKITLDGLNGNISATGDNFYFGNTTSYNTFVVDAYSLIDSLIVTNDLSVTSGEITTPSLTTSNLEVNGPVVINNGDAEDGYVWTASGNTGVGTWKSISLLPWRTVVTNGLTATDLFGTTSVVPAGFFEASVGDEIFVNTAAGPFTINLPANPVLGNRIRFVDHNGTWSSINKAYVFPRPTGIIKTFSFSDVNVGTEEITITAHRLVVGQRGTLSSTGTLPTTSPAGEFTSFVYVIVVDVNTIKFANSYANALSNTPIDITVAGSGTHSFTSGTIMNSAVLELDVQNSWAEIMFNGASWRVITS